MPAPAASGTSDSTQVGIYHAYASVAAASLTAGATAVSVTVPGAQWYDVEVTIENNSATTGTIAEDHWNFGLFSDPVTAATMKLARKLPVNPFVLATPAIPASPVYRTRVFAQSTISIVAESAATASTNWLFTVTAAPVSSDASI
jgi:hypothetical protein